MTTDSFDTSIDGLENINMFGTHPSISGKTNSGLYVHKEPIILDTPFKHEVSRIFAKKAIATITTVNRDGKSKDHAFESIRKAIEFIEEFERTGSEDEEIYIAE